MRIPRTGQISGTRMSSAISANSMPRARDLALALRTAREHHCARRSAYVSVEAPCPVLVCAGRHTVQCRCPCSHLAQREKLALLTRMPQSRQGEDTRPSRQAPQVPASTGTHRATTAQAPSQAPTSRHTRRPRMRGKATPSHAPNEPARRSMHRGEAWVSGRGRGVEPREVHRRRCACDAASDARAILHTRKAKGARC
jgi:hypothetical protein